MPFNHAEYIYGNLKETVGSPILASLDSHHAAAKKAVEDTLLDYWIMFPIQYQQNITIEPKSNRVITTIDSLKTLTFQNEDIRSKSFYLGIIRIERVPWAAAIYNFDSYLLGQHVGQSLSHNSSYSRISTDKTYLQATQDDLTAGEIEYDFDVVNDRISYIFPVSYGQANIWHGFGIWDPEELKYLKITNLPLFTKMATEKFLEIVITSLTLAQPQSEVTISVDFLQAQLDTIREQLTEEKPQFSYPVLMWG